MASKFRPSMAKNMFRRSLRAVVDPHPNDEEVAELWLFFGGECVYRGVQISVGNKDAHLDHLESETTGGTNHISNRVPSCASCNEKEKREMPWLQFLEKKVPAPDLLEARRQKILAWQGRFPRELWRVDDAVGQQLREEIEKAVAAYDVALQRLRSIRGRQPAATKPSHTE